MQDKELYQQILGFHSPCSVQNVELDVENSEIRINVSHRSRASFCCPKCQASLAYHHHAGERCWRYLDSCQFKTILTGRTPRVKYSEYWVKNVDVPWAEKLRRFTLLFERLAIDVLLTTQTVMGAMSILRTQWVQT